MDRAEDGTVFVGSRAGDLWVLNQHGTPIGHVLLDGWVGTLKVIERPHEGEGRGFDLYLMAGTKRGTCTCFQVEISPDEAEFLELSVFSADNTLREIDSCSTGTDVLVAAGSEDRHVYLAALSDLVAGGREPAVGKVCVNGWIRSVAFCRDPDDGRPAIAAGCGDKHVYFLGQGDFAKPGHRELRRVFVDAKVHCVVGDPASLQVFCASDARRLSVLGWTGQDYQEITQLDVPHRVTRMTFADEERRNLLAACEDGNVYVFDTEERKLIAHLPVGERLFAMQGVTGAGSGEILIGRSYGRLSCCFYAAEPGMPAIPRVTRGRMLEESSPDDFGSLAKNLLFGPTRQEVLLGIGRFVHVTEASPRGNMACVVGTDGGDVCILDLEDGRAAIRHRQSFEKVRVWAVDAEWVEPGKLRVLAATSGSNIVRYVIDMQLTPPEVVRQDEIELSDWPREIRAVADISRADESRILVCCENGDLLVHGDDPLQFNTGQILRSGYARRVGNSYDILTGSDDCFVTRFHDDEEQWRYPADDRVREVLIDDGECVAVSEDRFLYVLADDGSIRWRYRFPHRALCVDIYRDPKSGRQYVVGCGDGCVYFVNEDGIQAGYQFPDRIRDVKVLEDGELIVACEDGLLYLAPTLGRFLSEYYDDRQGTLIDRKIVELRTNAGVSGFDAIATLEPEERLLLLRHLGDWFASPDSGRAMALIDAAATDVLESDHVYLHYVFATALVEASLRANLAAGRSRIANHLQANANNPFVVHALLSTISDGEANGSWPYERRVLADTIIVKVPLADEWIREELVRHLHRSDFFSLAEEGFDRCFRTVRIRYSALSEILRAAEELGSYEAREAPLSRLLAHLASPHGDRQAFERVLAMAEGQPAIPMVREGMALLGELRWDGPADGPQLARIKEWIHAKVASAEIIEAIVTPLLRHESEGALDGYAMGLLAEVIEGRLQALDPRISAHEYLAIHFALSFVLAVAPVSPAPEGAGAGSVTR